MTTSLIALTTLLACSSGKLDGDCPDGQVEDADGNCVDDSDGGASDGGSGDGGTADGGSADGGTADGGSSDGGSTDGGSTDGGSGDGGSGLCDAVVTGSAPEEGDNDVRLDSRISFDLSEADPSASITLASLAGSSVAGSTWTADDDHSVWFEASGPLQGATDYVATLDWCGGSETVSFRTQDPGAPVKGLEGRAYNVDLAGATWVEPAGVGDLISGSLTEDLLLQVADVTETTIEMFGALGTGGEQDTCQPTIDFPVADFSENPFFQLGPSDVSFDFAGTLIALNNVKLTGSFNSDGAAIEGGAMSAELDVRNMADLIGDLLGTTDPDDICGLLVFVGAECADCAGDGAPYCLSVRVEDLDAPEIADSLDEITMADCHPDCAASWDNPHCDTSGW